MSPDQLLLALGGMADWVAVAFAVLTTSLIKSVAFKVDLKTIPIPVFTGWRATLQRFMPFVPVLMAVLYVVPVNWGIVSWQVIFNKGIVSGTIGAWGYKAIKDALFATA